MSESIKYTTTLETRFSDLDPYGHVNSKYYLDYAINGRWLFFRDNFGLEEKQFLEMGYGFFLLSAQMNFALPIKGMQKILSSSWVVDDGAKVLTCPYQITTPDQSKTFSEGTLIFGVIDLKTNKVTQLPDDYRKYFFEDK